MEQGRSKKKATKAAYEKMVESFPAQELWPRFVWFRELRMMLNINVTATEQLCGRGSEDRLWRIRIAACYTQGAVIYVGESSQLQWAGDYSEV